MSSKIRATALLALPLTALLLAGCSAGTSASVAGGTGAGSASTSASSAPKAVSWYSKNYPTFTTKTFKGTGDDVVKLPKGAAKGILKAKHSGSANFIVSLLDSRNQQTADSGINAIGHFSGKVGYGLIALGNAPKSLKIQADGKWSITVSDFDSAKSLPASGHGDGVYKYDGKSKTAKITHKGSANFIVDEYSDALVSNLQINKIGNYSGRSPVDGGPAIITVQADGSWTIK